MSMIDVRKTATSDAAEYARIFQKEVKKQLSGFSPMGGKAVVAEGAETGKKRGRPAKAKTDGEKKPRKKRGSSAESDRENAATLQAAIARMEGESGFAISEISKAAEMMKDETVRGVKLLLGAGILRKEGEKRNTRYFLVPQNGASASAPSLTRQRKGRVQSMRHAGRCLRRARMAVGISQDELAKKMGLPREHVAQAERRGSLTSRILNNYAMALGYSLAMVAPDGTVLYESTAEEEEEEPQPAKKNTENGSATHCRREEGRANSVPLGKETGNADEQDSVGTPGHHDQAPPMGP